MGWALAVWVKLLEGIIFIMYSEKMRRLGWGRDGVGFCCFGSSC